MSILGVRVIMPSAYVRVHIMRVHMLSLLSIVVECTRCADPTQLLVNTTSHLREEEKF